MVWHAQWWFCPAILWCIRCLHFCDLCCWAICTYHNPFVLWIECVDHRSSLLVETFGCFRCFGGYILYRVSYIWLGLVIPQSLWSAPPEVQLLFRAMTAYLKISLSHLYSYIPFLKAILSWLLQLCMHGMVFHSIVFGKQWECSFVSSALHWFKSCLGFECCYWGSAHGSSNGPQVLILNNVVSVEVRGCYVPPFWEPILQDGHRLFRFSSEWPVWTPFCPS